MLEGLKQRWAPRVLSWIPNDCWHRLTNVRLVLPYYHVVSDQRLAHIAGLYTYRNLRLFREDLEFLLRHYQPVSLPELIDHLDGKRNLPRKCFLLSFDDGFREVYEVAAPLLRAAGIPAVFFLLPSVIDNRELCYAQKKSLLLSSLRSAKSTAANEVGKVLSAGKVPGSGLEEKIRGISYLQRRILDRLAPILGRDFAGYASSVKPYLSAEQVKSLLNMGFSVGAHSLDHPSFPELRLEEQLFQTSQSMAELSRRFDCQCPAFAFPYGDARIGPEYFQKAFSGGRLRISFGTGGMLRHFFPRNLERFTMERTEAPAEQIFSRQFGRALLYGAAAARAGSGGE